MILYKRSGSLRCAFSLFTILLPMVVVSAAYGQNTIAQPTSINLAIIFDLSNSTDSLHPSFRTTSKELVKGLSPLFHLKSQGRYFIIGVSTVPIVALDGSTDSGLALNTLSELASRRRDGATALYDACYLAIKRVSQDERSNQVVLVVSDGWDTTSRRDLNEISTALVARKVKLYAIDVGDPEHKFGDKGAKVLDAMASISRGEAFHPKRSEDLSIIVESIVSKLQE